MSENGMKEGNVKVKNCIQKHLSGSLVSSIDADGASSHMGHLSRDIFLEISLIPRQHLQHRPQIEPPLNLGHPVP